MRSDPAGSLLTEPHRDPRVAVQLVYTIGSIYLTNRSGISNVPGTPVHGVLTQVSSSSQRLIPTEGRTMVGSLDVTSLDLNGAITDGIRSQILDENEGASREVRLFTGDTDDFTDGTWRRVGTYFIDGGIGLSGLKYRFSCSDLNRELRTEVFDFKRTRLSVTLEVDATSMIVTDAEEFETLEHTASFSDAPLQTVGYVRLEQSGEIIRWTDKVDNGNGTWTLQGLTREIANTAAVRIEVEGSDSERWPEVQEYIYLELPAVALDYAIRTGTILGTSITLPAHWCAGVSTSLVETDSWTNIGTDLYDPANQDGGLVLRFIGLERQDAKRFLEEQVLVPMWCSTVVTPEGKWRLKRTTSVLSTASTIRTLYEGADFRGPIDISHEIRELVNQLAVKWNYNGTKLTRTQVLINLGSQEREQKIAEKRLELYGLSVNRHQTNAVMSKLIDGYTDRFGSPPIRFRASLSPRHNNLEVGDVVRAVLPGVRDYAGGSTFDRACEVQGITVNWMTGKAEGEFFASTNRTAGSVPVDDETPIADSWWSSEGTRIDSVLTVVSNQVTSSGTLTGADDLRDPSAIYYWEGTLTVDADVLLTQNVQLRVKNLVINEKLDGAGRGIAAVVDPNTVGAALVFPSDWTEPTLGSTRGGGGIYYTNGGNFYVGQGQPVTLRGNDSLPRANLYVENGVLKGLPAEARGTPGQYGGPVYSTDGIVRGKGGVGGKGGAGLLIVCETLSFGVNGDIDLSGEAGATGQAGDVSHAGNTLRPGTGGGGAAGGVYVIYANRANKTAPTLETNFTANHGSSVVSGNPIGMIPPDGAPASPWTGSVPGIGAEDNYGSSYVFQHVPKDEALGEGALERPPIPTITSAVATDTGILVTFDGLPESDYGVVQLFSSITNDLSDAVRVAQIRAPYFHHVFDRIQSRYYWARVVDGSVKGDFSSGQFDGFQATGGASDTVVEWIETFDPYTSREDFERNYEITGGDPTITFPSNGVDGGKTMLVTGFMNAVGRRNYPYDPRKMYEAEVRFRKSVGQAGNEAATIGFLGVKADGVTLIDSVGTSFDSLPNRSLLANFDMGLVTAGEWRRMRSWIQGSANSNLFTDAPPGLATRDRMLATPVQIRAASDGAKAAYVRPCIRVGSPSATTAAVEIDHVLFARPSRGVPSVPHVEDSNFGVSLDSDYWLSDESPGNTPVQIVQGAGLNGGNAAFWNVTGPMAFLFHRQLFPVSDVLRTALTYRLLNVSSMNASTTLHVGLQGYKLNATAGALGLNYYSVGGGSSGSTPSATVAMNTLTADGNWNNVSLSLSSLFSDAHLDGADYMRLFIWVAPVGTNDFDFYVGRVNAVRS